MTINELLTTYKSIHWDTPITVRDYDTGKIILDETIPVLIHCAWLFLEIKEWKISKGTSFEGKSTTSFEFFVDLKSEAKDER